MQMRRQAAGLVQGLTGSAEGAQALSQAGAELLPALLWLVGDSSQISRAALTSLVNLSQVSSVAYLGAAGCEPSACAANKRSTAIKIEADACDCR